MESARTHQFPIAAQTISSVTMATFATPTAAICRRIVVKRFLSLAVAIQTMIASMITNAQMILARWLLANVFILLLFATTVNILFFYSYFLFFIINIEKKKINNF
jgi:hypothetical protein